MPSQSYVRTELSSQPECWRRAAEAAAAHPSLPRHGERVAVLGCGTSWFMAGCYAALREHAGHGETDAFAASEMPSGRAYDRVLAITRSGTTTEVLRALAALRGRTSTVVITAVPAEVHGHADAVVDLSLADERSVVQTRFATSTLAFLRTHLGEDVEPVSRAAEEVLAGPVDESLLVADQISFLGAGWTVGLAHEAALKMREAATAWTESYPAMEYRHGPMSITQPGRVAWMFGSPPPGLADDVHGTGGSFVHSGLDPLVDLVRAQLVAVTRAERHGLDPDQPRNLTRSVVLQ